MPTGTVSRLLDPLRYILKRINRTRSTHRRRFWAHPSQMHDQRPSGPTAAPDITHVQYKPFCTLFLLPWSGTGELGTTIREYAF